MEAGSLKEAIDVLSKPPSDRKENDLLILKTSTQSFKFFEDVGPDMHLACCKALRLQRYESGTVVFHKGTHGDSFCIVLRGAVSVLVPQSGSRLSDIGSLRQVGVLMEGQTFGELSLLQNRDRAATIVAREKTCLGVLSKEDFDRILRMQEERRLHAKVQFFQSLPAFQQWSELELSRFVYYFHEERFKRGAVVYTEGASSAKAYVVIHGEFRFSRITEVDTRKRELQLMYKGSNEMFGEEDLLAGRKRTSTCTCDSYEGRLYSIGSEDFLKFCQRDSTLRYLKSYEQAERRWISERTPRILKAEHFKLNLSLQKSKRLLADITRCQTSSSLKRDLMTHCNIATCSFTLPQLSLKVQPLTERARTKKIMFGRLKQSVQRKSE
jgi:CRP-like cAMP-binding protein